MTVESVCANTTLSRIISMVEEAEGAKFPIQTLVDKVTYVFVRAFAYNGALIPVAVGVLCPAFGLSSVFMLPTRCV